MIVAWKNCRTFSLDQVIKKINLNYKCCFSSRSRLVRRHKSPVLVYKAEGLRNIKIVKEKRRESQGEDDTSQHDVFVGFRILQQAGYRSSFLRKDWFVHSVQMLLALCRLHPHQGLQSGSHTIAPFTLSESHTFFHGTARCVLFWSLWSVTGLILLTRWTWSSTEASKTEQNRIKEQGLTARIYSTLNIHTECEAYFTISTRSCKSV